MSTFEEVKQIFSEVRKEQLLFDRTFSKFFKFLDGLFPKWYLSNEDGLKIKVIEGKYPTMVFKIHGPFTFFLTKCGSLHYLNVNGLGIRADKKCNGDPNIYYETEMYLIENLQKLKKYVKTHPEVVIRESRFKEAKYEQDLCQFMRTHKKVSNKALLEFRKLFKEFKQNAVPDKSLTYKAKEYLEKMF